MATSARRLLVLFGLLSATCLAAQAPREPKWKSTTPINDRPGPYNNRIQIFDQDGTFLDEWTQFGRPSGIAITRDDTIYVADSESWGPDEPGWKKGIRIGSARDGSVTYFIEDIESTTADHSGAEGVGVDREGNVFGSVVRRMMLEKHVLRK
jgi:sugar lactone lactonase YvrE